MVYARSGRKCTSRQLGRSGRGPHFEVRNSHDLGIVSNQTLCCVFLVVDPLVLLLEPKPTAGLSIQNTAGSGT